MKSLGADAGLLPVALEDNGRLTVEGEVIGRLDGLRFTVDPAAGVADRRMLLAAGEKALPGLLAERVEWLLSEGLGELSISGGAIKWQGRSIAEITFPGSNMPGHFGSPRLALTRDCALLAEGTRTRLESGLAAWLEEQLAPLEPLRKLAEAARDPEAGSEARALVIALIEARGVISREEAGLQHLPKESRPFLRKLGVTFGALDIFAAPLLKPAPRRLLHALGLDHRPLNEAMLSVLAEGSWPKGRLPAGYRFAGGQAIRVDLAEKIFRAAFDARSAKPDAPHFRVDLALPISVGLTEDNARRLLGSAGFRVDRARALPEGASGAPAPDRWSWRPRRNEPARQNAGRKSEPRHGDHQGPRRSPKPQGRGKPGAKPASPRPAAPRVVDTGPARAGGAFDGLADLLKK